MKTVALFLFLFACESQAGQNALTYEPTKVELTGTLDLQTFPGPPNYESIQEGDEIERHFYLKLDAPVDVMPRGEHPTVDNPEEEKNIKVMQLAIDAEDDTLWARFRRAGKGAHVKIRGSLFRRFTGHHHSRVLLGVNEMEPLKRSVCLRPGEALLTK